MRLMYSIPSVSAGGSRSNVRIVFLPAELGQDSRLSGSADACQDLHQVRTVAERIEFSEIIRAYQFSHDLSLPQEYSKIDFCSNGM